MKAQATKRRSGGAAQGRPGRTPRAVHARRRGLILVVVLVVIALLALTMAGFVFFVRSETSGTIAFADAQQARLTAESGLEELIAVLRVERHNPAAWFDVPARFRHTLVWSDKYDREQDPVRELGSRRELLESDKPVSMAWRYAIVGESVTGLQNTLRYGPTPESSKLNLNTATDEQLQRLLLPVLTGLQIENPQELVNALLDWRDADDVPRDGGAENEYYNTLTPPYSTKYVEGSPQPILFDSLEELLLIKGFNAAILYGEDTNRNGLLDPNEDDGPASDPAYDNADNVLNRGIAPYLTVWSREPDTALDNKQRINLNGEAGYVAAAAATIPEGEISQATLAFILQLKQGGFDFSQIGSPAELYRVGASAGGGQQLPDSFGNPQELEDVGDTKGDGQQKKDPPEDDEETGDVTEDEGKDAGDEEGDDRGGEADGGGEGDGDDEGQPPPPPNRNRGNRGRAGRGGSANAAAQLAGSPVTVEELGAVMNRFSTRNSQQTQGAGIVGLININTAPQPVLELIPGITPEAAAAIVAGRQQLEPAQLQNIAWPLVAGLIDTDTFHRMAPYITIKAYQFHVEIVGYADHVKLFRRYEWVIEMIGPLAQVKYYRDLTSLGFAWPVDDDSIVVSGR